MKTADALVLLLIGALLAYLIFGYTGTITVPVDEIVVGPKRE